MKKNINIAPLILLIILAINLLTSCDKIDAPYTENTIIPIDTTNHGDTAIVYKNFLLEDYTGHKCPNCPTAAKTADSLKNIYKDRLIVLSVHAGYFSSFSGTGAYSYNFRTPQGTEFNTFFNITAYPSGLINRKFFGGKRILDHTDWPGIIASQMAEKSEVKIDIKIDYDSTINSGNVVITNTFLSPQNQVNKLSVFIMEDSIINWQKNGNPAIGSTPDIEFYTHNHVLRSSLNSTWGDTINNSNVLKGWKKTKSYPIILDNNWKKKQCYLVVFIYNANTLEIIQVNKKKIIL